MDKGTQENRQMAGKKKQSTNTDELRSHTENAVSEKTISNLTRKLHEVDKKQLKYVYSNAKSLGNETKVLELPVQCVKVDVIRITET